MSISAALAGRKTSSISSSPDKQNSKKIQSSIKASVSAFGKQVLNAHTHRYKSILDMILLSKIMSWRHDVGEMRKLLHKLAANLKVKDAVERSKYHMTANRVFEPFPGARDLITGAIIKESENLISQLRTFMRGIGDVVTAMRFTASGVYNEVVDLPAAALASSASVFTEDHMLDIQQLYGQFENEYTRKTALVEGILRREKVHDFDEFSRFLETGGLRSNSDWIDTTAVEQAAEHWSDQDDFSFIDCEKGTF